MPSKNRKKTSHPLQQLYENRYLYEVTSLMKIFGLSIDKITKGPNGQRQFVCPWCKRIKTPSLIVFAMHLTGWHQDKINDNAKITERKAFKILGDYLAGDRKTIPREFRHNEKSQAPTHMWT